MTLCRSSTIVEHLLCFCYIPKFNHLTNYRRVFLNLRSDINTDLKHGEQHGGRDFSEQAGVVTCVP